MRKALLFTFLLLSCRLVCSAQQIDTVTGAAAPASACRDFRALAHYLCDPLSGDRQKTNAVYNWITHNIRYDVYALKTYPSEKTPQEEIAEKTFTSRKGVCEGYSVLFTEMCREAGLKAVTIEGYAKDWMVDNGDKLYIPRHEWCAVLVNGTWELVDPTWGAGGLVQAPGWLRRMLNRIMHSKVMYAKKLKFQFHYDPQYLMQDPMVFRLKHLPTDPIWQLTDTVMPREYFETGDSAVKSFNALCKRVKNTPELERISGLDERQKIFEYADRAYKYNDRFPDVMAQKEIFRAVSELEKAFTDTTIETGLLLVTDAQNGLKKSLDRIKDQKKAIPDEYTVLKKKNKAKSQAAKQDISKIKTDDKRIIATCKKYTNSANSKYAKARKKQGDASKRKQGVNPNNINRVDAAKVQKKKSSPELKALEDSLAVRRERMKVVQQQLDGQTAVLKKNLDENSIRLDTLAKYLGAGDSIIIKQTIDRLQMKDNYDDEVISSTRTFAEIKFSRSDTLLKYYLITFDTITTLQDRRQKTRIAQLDIYKKNLRTLEQYRKWNYNDTEVTGQYASCVQDYLEAIAAYNNDIVSMAQYLKGNKKLFAGITKLNKRQLRITEYMEKAENMRKSVEEKKIAGKQAFDTKETDNQKVVVQDLIDRLQQITDARN